MSRSALSALLGRRTYRRLASLDDEEQGAGLDGEASEEEQEMDEAFRGGDMSPSARSVVVVYSLAPTPFALLPKC